MDKADRELAALVAKQLTPFESRDVTGCAVEVRKVGGGLSPAVAFAPVELHYGQKVYVLFEAEVGSVRFDPIMAKDGGDTGASKRVHILAVTSGGATFVDPQVGRPLILEQRERIELLREEALGVQRLELGEQSGDGESGARENPARKTAAKKTAAKKAAATRRTRASSKA